MGAKINFLIINCRDFNFPHAGNVDVKLMRVKHQIKIKVIHSLPKTLRKDTSYYVSHTENFLFEHITNNTVKQVYDEVVERLNYADKFSAHYGMHEGDVAGAYEPEKTKEEFLHWLFDTIFSFR